MSEQDIKTTLDAYGGLSALVVARNYYKRLPQRPTFPNVVFTRVDTVVDNTLDSQTGRENKRYQIDVRGSTAASCRAVVVQVKAAMAAATLFKALLLDDRDFDFEDDLKIHRVILDFSIW